MLDMVRITFAIHMVGASLVYSLPIDAHSSLGQPTHLLCISHLRPLLSSFVRWGHDMKRRDKGKPGLGIGLPEL